MTIVILVCLLPVFLLNTKHEIYYCRWWYGWALVSWHCDSPDTVAGFNLHAGTSIGAEDRVGLENLLRYMGRPPLSAERLSQAADGRLILKFKKAWSEGTSAIIMEPQEFLERLTSLVPPPRKNQIR